jgi:3-oxoadipate enol-lactonase
MQASHVATSKGRARARDGTGIAYTLSGNADAKHGIVLVHSLAMDQRFWEPVAERLMPLASILLYDCRGHGESDIPPGPYSVGMHADDLADLLAQVGWDSALVGGASMGGCIAIQFAGTYPERTTGLAMIDTTAWYGANAPKEWEERAQRALQSGFEGMVEFQATRWFSDTFRAAHPEVVRQCVEIFLRNDVRAYAETCRMLGAFDGRKLLASIAVPAAIVVGEEDYAAPRPMAEALHAAVAGSTLTVIPGVRHLTPIECPDRIASELSGLLDRSNRSLRRQRDTI